MDRWEMLFAQLESEFAFDELVSRQALASDLSRAETARISVHQRLKASAGQCIDVHLNQGRSLTGTVVNCHKQWLLLTIGARGIIVPNRSIVGVGMLSRKAISEPEPERSPQSLPKDKAVGNPREVTLNSVLRSIARGRNVVRVVAHGHEYRGRIQRVGSDHIDLLSGGVGDWEERTNPVNTTVVLDAIEYVVLE